MKTGLLTLVISAFALATIAADAAEVSGPFGPVALPTAPILASSAAPSDAPYLGLWATRPPEQSASLREICRDRRFGYLEITPDKVYEYESDCDLTATRQVGPVLHLLQAACFAEGEDFTVSDTIKILAPDRIRVERYVEKWNQKSEMTYYLCR